MFDDDLLREVRERAFEDGVVQVSMRQDLEKEIPFAGDGETLRDQGLEERSAGEEVDVAHVGAVVKRVVVREEAEDGEGDPVHQDRHVRG